MGSRLNNIYRGMKTRCYNPNHRDYDRYGGRGITVCDEWLYSDHKTHEGWLAFRDWALSNGYSDELTLDRIDNNKGYSPDNCRWINIIEQANNKRNNVLVTYNGETKTVSEWAKDKGVNYKVLLSRIRKCKMKSEVALKKENLHDKIISYKGKTQSLAKWCEELNLNYYTVYSRLRRSKMSVEDAFKRVDYNKNKRR